MATRDLSIQMVKLPVFGIIYYQSKRNQAIITNQSMKLWFWLHVYTKELINSHTGRREA